MRFLFWFPVGYPVKEPLQRLSLDRCIDGTGNDKVYDPLEIAYSLYVSMWFWLTPKGIGIPEPCQKEVVDMAAQVTRAKTRSVNEI